MTLNVWAISDLHLSHARPDPRERFAARWSEHAAQIAAQWRQAVAKDDIVLLPGDLSTARNHRDLQPDLAWLERLPGTKVLSPGNHDRWWNGVERIRPMLRRSIRAVGGDAVALDGLIACGTLGAPADLDESDPVAARALAALERALEAAVALRTAAEPIYVLWHYPPFDPYRRPGPVVARLEAAGAAACVYGHLHQQAQWSAAVQGTVNGVRYHVVAADALGFRPIRVGRVESRKPATDETQLKHR
jgi:predicted phosphohydrolase